MSKKVIIYLCFSNVSYKIFLWTVGPSKVLFIVWLLLVASIFSFLCFVFPWLSVFSGCSYPVTLPLSWSSKQSITINVTQCHTSSWSVWSNCLTIFGICSGCLLYSGPIQGLLFVNQSRLDSFERLRRRSWFPLLLFWFFLPISQFSISVFNTMAWLLCFFLPRLSLSAASWVGRLSYL